LISESNILAELDQINNNETLAEMNEALAMDEANNQSEISSQDDDEQSNNLEEGIIPTASIRSSILKKVTIQPGAIRKVCFKSNPKSEVVILGITRKPMWRH